MGFIGTAFYLVAFGLGIVELIRKPTDANFVSILLYLVGFEIAYKIGKGYIFYELAKYLGIAVSTLYILLKRGVNKNRALPFVVLFALFLPSLIISSLVDYIDPNYLRKIILQNSLGPMLLVVSGIALSSCKVTKKELSEILFFGVLPGIVVLAMLFTKVSIADLEFDAPESNSSAAGGFGANQVSTALGYYALLLVIALINKIKLFKFRLVELGFLILFVFRGLLTFSRGGVFTLILSTIAAIVTTSVFSSNFRRRVVLNNLIYIIPSLILLFGAALYVNKITHNMLYYRYMGYSMNEIVIAQRYNTPIKRSSDQLALSNRDHIAEMELSAFKENFYLGTGVGLGKQYRERNFGFSTSSHTEYTRLIGEHGIPGVLIILMFIQIGVIYLFRFRNHPTNLYFFVAMYSLSLLTMFHSATRLGLATLCLTVALISISENNEARLSG